MDNVRHARFLRWALAACCGALAGLAHAAGMVESVTGSVQMAGPAGASAATRGAAVKPGTTIDTGAGARVVLKFDDGQIVALDQNTELKVLDYRYDAGNLQASAAAFDFVTGSARFVHGRIAEDSAANFSLRTPKATIGVKGADFSVASGSLYVSVSRGVVSVSNTGGAVSFSAGQFGFIDTVWTRPIEIASSQLPSGVAGSFARLGGINLAAAGGAAGGAGGATGAAAASGGLSGGAIAAMVAVGLAAAGGGGGGGGSTPTATHH